MKTELEDSKKKRMEEELQHDVRMGELLEMKGNMEKQLAALQHLDQNQDKGEKREAVKKESGVKPGGAGPGKLPYVKEVRTGEDRCERFIVLHPFFLLHRCKGCKYDNVEKCVHTSNLKSCIRYYI